MVTGCYDGRVRVVLDDGSSVAVCVGHTDAVKSVRLLNPGWIATSSDDKTASDEMDVGDDSGKGKAKRSGKDSKEDKDGKEEKKSKAKQSQFPLAPSYLFVSGSKDRSVRLWKVRAEP